MNYTDNLNLNLPEGSDYALIEKINENMETLDEKYEELYARSTPISDFDAGDVIEDDDLFPYHDVSVPGNRYVTWADLLALIRDASGLAAHLRDYQNPHRVKAIQTNLSDPLTTLLGLAAQSNTEDALGLFWSQLQAFNQALNGTAAKYLWAVYKRWAFPTGSAKTIHLGTPVELYPNPTGIKILFSQNITVDPTTQAITLVNPQTRYLYGGNQSWQAVNLTGFFTLPSDQQGDFSGGDGYVKPSMGYVYAISPSVSVKHHNLREYGDNETFFIANNIYVVAAGEQFVRTEQGDTADAYPQDGWRDGLHYIRTPFGGKKIASCESRDYTGTGGNSRTFTFDFTPRLIVIVNKSTSPYALGIIPFGGSGYLGLSSSLAPKGCLCDSAHNQLTLSDTFLNQNNVIYQMVAIG